MPLAPVEILTLAFPGNQFNGSILPELERLVSNATITIIDALLVSRDAAGAVTYAELDELGANVEAAALSDLVQRFDELISEDDVAELASGLEPNSTAVVFVFEHTWMKPLRDAIVSSNGVLLDSVRIPGAVVDEVLAVVAELD